jgi:hypothetical protein
MLRYYGKGSIDKRLNSILETIKEVHGIPSEVLDISQHGTYDPRQEQQTYERDFKPRAKLLKKRTGHPITSLRSRKARSYFVSIPGTLAIVGTQGIEWYTLGEDNISEFLRGVLAEGPSRIEELCND